MSILQVETFNPEEDFQNLSPGEVFKFNNVLYLKVIATDTFNSVNLEKYTLCMLNPNASIMVDPCSVSKLVIR